MKRDSHVLTLRMKWTILFIDLSFSMTFHLIGTNVFDCVLCSLFCGYCFRSLILKWKMCILFRVCLIKNEVPTNPIVICPAVKVINVEKLALTESVCHQVRFVCCIAWASLWNIRSLHFRFIIFLMCFYAVSFFLKLKKLPSWRQKGVVEDAGNWLIII